MIENHTIPLLIPSAGLGSRLFPTTWGIPKELFPLGDKPAIHHILEEASIAFIKNVICVTSPRKESLTEYLSYNEKIHGLLLNNKEREGLRTLDALNAQFSYIFTTQDRPLGVGDAMYSAKQYIHSDFFSMMYPDDIIIDKKNGIAALFDIHSIYKSSVIAVEKVSKEKIHSYGVINIKETVNKNLFLIDEIIEKPFSNNAPSEYGIIGRYIVSSNIFIEFSRQEVPCFISGLNQLMKNGEKIFAKVIDTERFDIGTIPGWLNTISQINKEFFIKSENVYQKIDASKNKLTTTI